MLKFHTSLPSKKKDIIPQFKENSNTPSAPTTEINIHQLNNILGIQEVNNPKNVEKKKITTKHKTVWKTSDFVVFVAHKGPLALCHDGQWSQLHTKISV